MSGSRVSCFVVHEGLSANKTKFFK